MPYSTCKSLQHPCIVLHSHARLLPGHSMTGTCVSCCRTVDNMEMVLLVEMLPQLTDAWQAAGHGAMDPRGNTCGAPENKYTGGPCTG